MNNYSIDYSYGGMFNWKGYNSTVQGSSLLNENKGNFIFLSQTSFYKAVTILVILMSLSDK